MACKEIELVDNVIAQLMEHYDHVQVFATRSEGHSGGTSHIVRGAGNPFARYGHVRSWLTKEDEIARQEARTQSHHD